MPHQITVYTEAEVAAKVAEAKRDAIERTKRAVADIQPDLSATAEEHKVGARAGHRRCLEMVAAALDDVLEVVLDAAMPD